MSSGAQSSACGAPSTAQAYSLNVTVAPPGPMSYLTAWPTGQAQPADVGAVARCILESLALKHAQTVDVLGATTGVVPVEIHIVGGGARNALLCRFTADASRLPVAAGPEEATLLGNLLMQAIALGEIGSVAQARDVVRKSFATTVYEPSGSPAWDEARQRFAELGVAA